MTHACGHNATLYSIVFSFLQTLHVTRYLKGSRGDAPFFYLLHKSSRLKQVLHACIGRVVHRYVRFAFHTCCQNKHTLLRGLGFQRIRYVELFSFFVYRLCQQLGISARFDKFGLIVSSSEACSCIAVCFGNMLCAPTRIMLPSGDL